MTTTTVVLLVVLWAAVLVPGAWRDRRSSPRSTVDGFHEAMARLATCDSRSIMVYGDGGARSVYPVRPVRQLLLERRRAVLARLLGFSGTTLLTALVAGGAWWALTWLSAAACLAYMAALRGLAVRRQQAERVVRMHPAHRARTEARRRVAEHGRTSDEVGDDEVTSVAEAPAEPMLVPDTATVRTVRPPDAATGRIERPPPRTGSPWSDDEMPGGSDELPYAVGQGR